MMTTDLVKVKEEAPVLHQPSGAVAQTVLTLFRDEFPSYHGPWRAPAYSTFSNANKTVVFLSIEDALKPEWNSRTKRYESRVRAESISVGSDYNLPVGAVTYIVSEDLVGFMGVVNEEPCVGGEDPKEMPR